MELITHLIAEAELLITQGREAEATDLLERACAESLGILGTIYCDFFRNEEKSMMYFNMSKMIDKANWKTDVNYAHALSNFNHHDKTLDAARRAVKFSEAQEFIPLFNYGIVLAHHHDPRAEEAFELALALKPDSKICMYNIGCVALRRGDYQKGWPLYENRLGGFKGSAKFYSRFWKYPLWDGKVDLNGKTVVVFIEQGLGDLFQFVRFVPLLQAKYPEAKLIVEVQGTTVDLIRHSLPGYNVVGRRDNNMNDPPDGDIVVSVCSLPLHLGIMSKEQIPQGPYIKIPGEKTLESDKLKIGFCWAGNSAHELDSYRTIPIKYFRALSDLPNVQLYGLQKHISPIYRKWKHGTVNIMEDADRVRFIDLTPDIKDMSDTARILNGLDLVICIDTSLAHLAGAMGKEVWMLTPYCADWRWGMDGPTCDWYPSMRLFRKTHAMEDWRVVFDRVVAELCDR